MIIDKKKGSFLISSKFSPGDRSHRTRIECSVFYRVWRKDLQPWKLSPIVVSVGRDVIMVEISLTLTRYHLGYIFIFPRMIFRRYPLVYDKRYRHHLIRVANPIKWKVISLLLLTAINWPICVCLSTLNIVCKIGLPRYDGKLVNILQGMGIWSGGELLQVSNEIKLGLGWD